MATATQRKFGEAAKAAATVCHAETTTRAGYKSCMFGPGGKMRSELKKRGFKVGGRKAAPKRKKSKRGKRKGR